MVVVEIVFSLLKEIELNVSQAERAAVEIHSLTPRYLSALYLY